MCVDDLNELYQKNIPNKNLDAVIICSANTKIDSCKLHEEESYRTNVFGVERIIKQTDDMGIKSVFLSSEAVFDGEKGMCSEDDLPNPITVYGNHKLLVEQYMENNIRNYLILRLSRVVGSSFGEKDVFNDFYNKIVENKDIVCIKGLSMSPTEVYDVAQCIIMALKNNLNGMYHLSSNNYVTRYSLAKMYADKLFGGYEKIYEKEYSEFQFVDNRSVYCGLNGERLSRLLKFKFLNNEEILNKYVAAYRKVIDCNKGF
jgi:dTDP-4-dehydrorhamnose reductase